MTAMSKDNQKILFYRILKESSPFLPGFSDTRIKNVPFGMCSSLWFAVSLPIGPTNLQHPDFYKILFRISFSVYDK